MIKKLKGTGVYVNKHLTTKKMQKLHKKRGY